jgi:hypothetical protein
MPKGTRKTGRLDKVKVVKRMSRQDAPVRGRGGFHANRADRRVRTMRTQDWLEDAFDFGEELEAMDIRIGMADIVTAFGDCTIGSKVTNRELFWRELAKAVEGFDFSKCRKPGQGLVPLPNAQRYLSCGVGRRTLDPADYVLRVYRGQVRMYLKRRFAADIQHGSAVVYTMEAYLDDPDLTAEERDEVVKCDYTHMLVAVLASAGPKPPLSPYRLVHNLAGGNNEALLWSADEIRQKAREVMDYWSSETGEGWCTVSD